MKTQAARLPFHHPVCRIQQRSSDGLASSLEVRRQLGALKALHGDIEQPLRVPIHRPFPVSAIDEANQAVLELECHLGVRDGRVLLVDVIKVLRRREEVSMSGSIQQEEKKKKKDKTSNLQNASMPCTAGGTEKTYRRVLSANAPATWYAVQAKLTSVIQSQASCAGSA